MRPTLSFSPRLTIPAILRVQSRSTLGPAMVVGAGGLCPRVSAAWGADRRASSPRGDEGCGHCGDGRYRRLRTRSAPQAGFARAAERGPSDRHHVTRGERPECAPVIGGQGAAATGGGGWLGPRRVRASRAMLLFHVALRRPASAERRTGAEKPPGPMKQRTQARQGGRQHPGRRRAVRGRRRRCSLPLAAHRRGMLAAGPLCPAGQHRWWRR